MHAEYSNQKTITFYPGQEVSVNGCLESIQMVQMPFTASELLAIEKVQNNDAEEENRQRIANLAQRKKE